MKDIKIQVYDKVNDRILLFKDLYWSEENNEMVFSGKLDVPIGDNIEIYSISMNGNPLYLDEELIKRDLK